jgi:protein-disulfide isomerase
MPTKRRNAKRRSKARPARKRSGPPTYLLIGAAVLVALIAVALIVLLGGGAGTPTAQSATAPGEVSDGSASAPVVVVEYADFQCPYCREFALGPEKQLKQDYVDKGQVRFVFRNFPFIGQESTWAAEAAECANDQGRFWDYHDKLYQEQGAENSGAFAQANLKKFAADLGLDTAQFNTCLDSGKYASLVRQAYDEAQRRQISSTPSFLVNGQLVTNGSSYPVLQAAIDAALKNP